LREVGRSGFPLSLSAAIVAAVFFALFGGGGQTAALPEIQARLDPVGLIMLISLAVVIITSLAGRHIIEALIYGNISAALLGLVTGRISLGALFSIPAKRGVSTGLVENGVNSVVGAIIFAILILAVTRILVECGIMRRILEAAERAVVRTVRQAEAFIVGVTILASIPISANAPAELLVGPSLVKPMGKKFGLAAARRANLMDCAVCTLFFTLPGHICVAAWYGAIYAAAQQYNIAAPPVSTALYNPYSWTLLVVLIFSIVTGWNRKMIPEGGEEESEEAVPDA
jgi:Na+/H+ antiporter NhaC